jgi:hypothetical protein
MKHRRILTAALAAALLAVLFVAGGAALAQGEDLTVTDLVDGETLHGNINFNVKGGVPPYTVTVNEQPLAKRDLYYLDGDLSTTYNIAIEDAAGTLLRITLHMQPIAAMGDPIQGLTAGNVKSSDRQAAQGVMDAVKAEQRRGMASLMQQLAMFTISDTAEALIERIDDVAGDLAAVAQDDVYVVDEARQGQETEIQTLLDRADVLLSTDNLTPAERTDLQGRADKLAACLKRITDVAADLDRLAQAAAGYDAATLQAGDLPALTTLQGDAAALWTGHNLTEAQRQAFKPVKEKLDALVTAAQKLQPTPTPVATPTPAPTATASPAATLAPTANPQAAPQTGDAPLAIGFAALAALSAALIAGAVLARRKGRAR